MDDLEDLDDRDIVAALRRHADELTAHVVDTDVALGVVGRRGRSRRRWRAGTGAALVAAAAAIGVIAVTNLTDERDLVRTPATAPAGVTTTVDDATPTSLPPSEPTIASTVPSTVSPTTTATPATTTPSTAATPTTATPETTVDSVGGSITVQLVAGAVSLVGDPAPTPGFTVRIDDDGPDRVRVRFERGAERSEIRVDVEAGQLVSSVTEG